MSELKTKLRSVDTVPEPDLWDRVERRARALPAGGEELPASPTPTGQRVAAAIVAFAVFGGAVALMAGVFDRETPIVGNTPLPSPVTFTFQADEYPSATLTLDGTRQEGQALSYSWDEDGGTSIVDMVMPDLQETVDVPAGAPLVIDGNATEVRAWVDRGDFSMPPPRLYELELADAPTMPTEEGWYVLEFVARWPQGGVTFLFPVQVVAAPETSPTPIDEPQRLLGRELALALGLRELEPPPEGEPWDKQGCEIGMAEAKGGGMFCLDGAIDPGDPDKDFKFHMLHLLLAGHRVTPQVIADVRIVLDLKDGDFDASLVCPGGAEPGGAGWDYGPDPQGITDDPVEWVGDNARGLDPALGLGMGRIPGGVAVAALRGEQPLAYVEFREDASGRFFPVRATACPESGIEDFA